MQNLRSETLGAVRERGLELELKCVHCGCDDITIAAGEVFPGRISVVASCDGCGARSSGQIRSDDLSAGVDAQAPGCGQGETAERRDEQVSFSYAEWRLIYSDPGPPLAPPPKRGRGRPRTVKPWEVAGVPKATWYRRQKAKPEGVG